jgi:hypothetical protein
MGISFVVMDSSLAIDVSSYGFEHSLFSYDDCFFVVKNLFTVVCRQGFFIGYDGFLEKLDEGHLHPLLEQSETNMSRPGIEPGPPRWEASMRASKELFGTFT